MHKNENWSYFVCRLPVVTVTYRLLDTCGGYTAYFEKVLSLWPHTVFDKLCQYICFWVCRYFFLSIDRFQCFTRLKRVFLNSFIIFNFYFHNADGTLFSELCVSGDLVKESLRDNGQRPMTLSIVWASFSYFLDEWNAFERGSNFIALKNCSVTRVSELVNELLRLRCKSKA